MRILYQKFMHRLIGNFEGILSGQSLFVFLLQSVLPESYPPVIPSQVVDLWSIWPSFPDFFYDLLDLNLVF